MERPTKRNDSAAAASEGFECEWGNQHPRLYEHLTCVRYSDGTVREPSTITVFVQDGSFRVSLNDRDNGASLYRAGSGLTEALVSLERALGPDGEADWRPWKKQGRKK